MISPGRCLDLGPASGVSALEPRAVTLDCQNPAASIMVENFPAHWTNRGTGTFETDIAGAMTFTNEGTVSTRGLVEWDGSIVNRATLSIGSGAFRSGPLTNATTGTLGLTLAIRRSFGNFGSMSNGDAMTR